MSSLPKDLKFFGYLNGNLSSNNNNTNSQQESGSDDDSASSNGSSGSNGTRRSNSPPCAATASGTPLPDPFIIGVAGGTASGKTTVCKMIMQQLEGRRVVVISQDSFYKNLSDEEIQLVHQSLYNFDHPDAFDYALIEKTLLDLHKGKPVEIPTYDFKTHRRVEGQTTKVYGCDVIIFEGILIFFHQHIRDLFDMKIFVDTDADTRLARRIRRDIAERGRELMGVLKQYETFVKPAFDDYVLPSKKYADIIIPRGGDNFVAIDLLVEHIKIKLNHYEEAKSRSLVTNGYLSPSAAAAMNNNSKKLAAMKGDASRHFSRESGLAKYQVHNGGTSYM